MYLNITLAELHIESEHRIYTVALGRFERDEGRFPSLFLIAFVDGKWHFDLAYLATPIRWAIRKLLCLN